MRGNVKADWVKTGRSHEKIGGGYFVFRRGKQTGRIAPGTLPFDHATLAQARAEADRLEKINPGERFVVLKAEDAAC